MFCLLRLIHPRRNSIIATFAPAISMQSNNAPDSRPVPVVIVAYQNPTQLDQCLAALGKQDTPVAPWVHDNSINSIYYTKAANLGLKKAIHEGHEFAIQL